MTFDLEIAGTSKLLKAGSFNLRETANRRCTASFQIDSEDRSYRPAEGAEVVIEEDGTRIFGGLIDSPSERGFGGPRHPGISTTVHATDFHVYAERRFVNLTLAAGTLKSQLTTLVTTYLAGYGVTLDAGQVNGPAMPELTYDYKRFDAVMNELMTLTADAGQPFIWEISYTKVLSAYQPSTEPAPFDLVGNDLPEVIGDIEVETRRNDEYANRIILKVQPKTQAGRIESFTGDGTPGPFSLQYTPTQLYGHILVQSGGGETLATDPVDPGVQWSYDPVTNSITREAGNTVVAEVYNLYFDGVFSGVWIADSGAAAADLVERVIILDSIPNDTTGQAFADAELAKRIAAIKTVKYVTWEKGLSIGQQQTINVSARDVNGAAVIVDLSSRDLVHRLERTVTAVIDSTQTNLGRSFQDDYQTWYGAKSGGGTSAVTVGSGGVPSGGPGLPFNAVQFNDGGSFGGDAEFTYNKDTDCLIVGALSSITAANPESCQVYGYDNHIADP